MSTAGATLYIGTPAVKYGEGTRRTHAKPSEAQIQPPCIMALPMILRSLAVRSLSHVSTANTKGQIPTNVYNACTRKVAPTPESIQIMLNASANVHALLPKRDTDIIFPSK